MESNVTLLLCYFLNLGRACLFVFNIKNIYFTNVERAFLHRSEMNTPQAGGKVNLYRFIQWRAPLKLTAGRI